MSLTHYLESQEDQNMTRLLNFIKTQERGFFVCFGMKEKGCLYSSDGGNMNERPFNKS